jgi:hypothetical protein
VTARGSLAFVFATAAMGATAAAAFASAVVIAADDDASLLWIAAPLIFCGTAWVALHRRCTTGSGRATALARTALGLLVAFWFVTGFSIGAFFTPAVALLLAATLLTPVPR